MMQTATIDGAARGAGRPWRGLGSVMWLAYLGIFFLPWTQQRPTAVQVAAGLSATAAFIGVYLHGLYGKPRSILPHVLFIALLGFALSRYSDTWSVFNAYAAAMAARMQPRRLALSTLAALQIALVAFGVGFHIFWLGWSAGVFFGLLGAGGTLLQADLERRNAQLVATQEEVRTLAALAERERIARDIHDLMGHTLTLVAVKADLAARLADRDPAGARREMDEVATAAREALAEVRAVVAGMSGASFAVELERGRQMLDAANVAADLQVETGSVDDRRDAVLAMALREAVTNVIRHAAASRCAIALRSDPRGELRLSIADNGKGGAIRPGQGLTGMRARLAAAGGRLDIESGAGGTTLTAVLPRLAA